MILDPIDYTQFSLACHRRRLSKPAPCRAPQLARLLLLMIIGGAFTLGALGPERVKATASATVLSAI